MKFVLEVDLGAVTDAPAEELSRILRYWAGNLQHYPLTEGSSETLMDSSYAPVGSWRIEDGNA